MSTRFIHAGHLIDGSGGPIGKDIVLTIKDGIITALTPFDRSMPPDPAHLTDLSFATLAPPFVDCRVDLARSGTIDPAVRAGQQDASFVQAEPVIRRHLLYLFRHGVLTVLDIGAGDHVRRVLRESHDAGREPVTIKTAWPIASLEEPTGQPCSDARHAGLRERSLSPWPGDLVRLIDTDCAGLLAGEEDIPPRFTSDAIRRVVDQARQAGKKVVVEAAGQIAVQQAIEAGCAAIACGAGMGRDNLQRMAANHVFLIPVLHACKTRAEAVAGAGTRSAARERLLRQLELVAQARNLGVMVALGTDAGGCGILHGEAVAEEMKLLGKAGYTVAEAVQCATANGAQLLGADASRIAVGHRADFLVARGTPAQLPRKFSYLEGIFFAGQPSPWYRKNPLKGVW